MYFQYFCFSDIHRKQIYVFLLFLYFRYPHEADLRSHKLNLRISDDGYLTGDMQMVLPPMRGIYMDLYTGYGLK
jgi:hypothetical protein